MKVSICIPTYEMHGKGGEFLERLLDSIAVQTHPDFEVIVSDHSRDEIVETVCNRWSHRMRINYRKYALHRGNASANINNAIDAASGEIIKPMHQDDFFLSPAALEWIERTLKQQPQCAWGAGGFAHTNASADVLFRYQIPFNNLQMLRPRNTIGAPAVAFFYRRLNARYDERLIWMNDAELYHRLTEKHGAPAIINEFLVAIRVWPNQVTSTLATERLRAQEIAYAHAKHGKAGDYHEKLGTRIIRRFIGAPLSQGRNALLNAKARFAFRRASGPNDADLLTLLANRYRSDKGTVRISPREGDRHNYTPVYSRYLASLRDFPVVMLEIGIGGGNSLHIWRDYFPRGHIHAVDIEDKSHLSGSRVTCWKADQSNREELSRVMAGIGVPIDIIIDDGGHYMHQQQISLGHLLPFIKPRGLYFIEDLHTSHWPFGGHTAVYDDQPIDITTNRDNTTLDVVKRIAEGKPANSSFLSAAENTYLDTHILECVVHDTASNSYGPNHLAMIRKNTS